MLIISYGQKLYIDNLSLCNRLAASYLKLVEHSYFCFDNNLSV